MLRVTQDKEKKVMAPRLYPSLSQRQQKKAEEQSQILTIQHYKVPNGSTALTVKERERERGTSSVKEEES